MTSSWDKRTHAFDSATGQPVALAPFVKDQWLASISSDGRWIGLGSGPPYSVFDRAAGKVIPGVSAMLGRIGRPRFQDIPDVVYALERDVHPLFWDLRTGKESPARVRLAQGDGFRLTRTLDGRAVAIVFRGLSRPSPDREVRLEVVELDTGKALELPLPLAGDSSPHFSYDGREVVTESNGAWNWRDLATGRSCAAVWRSRRPADHQSLSRDSLEVLSGEIDQYLRIYDLATGLQRGGDLLREPQTGSWGAGGSLWDDPARMGMAWADCVSSAPDGRLVFTMSRMGIARAWDTRLCRLQPTPATIPRRRLNNVSTAEVTNTQATYSPDGRRVVLARRAKDHALLLDARTGDLLGPPLRQLMVEHAVFSTDGRYLATAACQGTKDQIFAPDFKPMVVLRDGHTGEPIGKPWESPKLIHALAFSPDGKLLAVGGVGGTVVLDVPANTPRHVFREATCIRGLKWHADSRRLLALARPGWPGVGSGLRVWDAIAGKPLGSFRPATLNFLGPEATWLADSEELVSCESADVAAGSPVARRQGRTWRARGHRAPSPRPLQRRWTAHGRRHFRHHCPPVGRADGQVNRSSFAPRRADANDPLQW